jgi:hypothetical protein
MSVTYRCDRCGGVIIDHSHRIHEYPTPLDVCGPCHALYQGMLAAERIRVDRIRAVNHAAYWSHPNALRMVEA